MNASETRPKLKMMKAQSRPDELKARLDWGEPALTILDVRSRDAFNAGRIMGAISMPADRVVTDALKNFELSRDIYLYSETAEESASAAEQLRSEGFQNVSELTGGLPAWQAAGYPVEGKSSISANV